MVSAPAAVVVVKSARASVEELREEELKKWNAGKGIKGEAVVDVMRMR